MTETQTYTQIDAQRKTDAQQRRVALTAAGCSTYVLGLRPGQALITCLCCGLSSYHPSDREHLYCGFCHDWHTHSNR